MFHFRFQFRGTCCFLLSALFCCLGSDALSLKELYPYGSQDELLNKEASDVSSPEISLAVPIVHFQDTFGSVYVNDNGLLSFMTEISAYYNREFPLFYPIIAPMYSDVDTSKGGSGAIYYRETKEASLLDRASADVYRHFSGGQTFRATGLFIVTWSDVSPVDEKQKHLRNTVQLAIASNGTESYCFFLYPENGVQWTQGKKDLSNVYAYTQAGFMTGDGRFYRLPGSGTEQVKNFPIMSNVNRRGLFAYHLGNTGTGNIILPDRDYDRSLKNIGSLETCSSTDFPCLPSANCLGFSSGICCECQRGYFGNGRSCLTSDEPIRVNGKLNGLINDLKIEDITVYVYVETKDGRVYSGINGVQPNLGFDLQTALVPLSSVISWLFAVPINGAPNGFTLTGGRFNRTVVVVYPQTGHQATLTEQYLGLDVFNFVNVKSELRGTLPTIPTDMSVQVEEYTVEFTQVEMSVVKSRLTTAFTFGENSASFPMIIDQTIVFEQCPHKPMNVSASATRLAVGSNHITYETTNLIARYASDAKISFLSDNPCTVVRCGPNSACIVEGTKHRCDCSRGYEPAYGEGSSSSEPVCVDIDECRRNVCDPTAECFNEPGSFRCRCAPGYTGDGFYCQSMTAFENTCNNIRCHEYSECIQTKSMGPRCMCKNGYFGDGQQCQAMPAIAAADDCRNITLCDLNAECRPNRLQGKYVCVCKAGFRGDGIVCTAEAESCERLANCGTNAECISDESSNHAYYCACNPGYVGDGYTCIPQISSDDCSSLNNCHRAAQCLHDSASSTFVCRCNPGYFGDGYRCQEDDRREVAVTRASVDQYRENAGCNGPEGCSPHADCVTMPADETILRNECRCRPGYIGDGILCTATNECDPNSENQCQRNAVCLYSAASRRHECQCSIGYQADRTGRCQMATSASSLASSILNLACSVAADCHANATCRIDPDSLNYHCRCNVGFEGDGKRLCRRLQSCQLHNSCDVHASCVLDRRSDAYRCECNSGFAGDGHRCRPLRSCGEDRSICHRNADCQYSYLMKEYACSCMLGFIGDGYTCAPLPVRGSGGEAEEDYLLLAQGATILRMAVPNADGTRVEKQELTSLSSSGYPLITKSRQIIVGLDVDCLQGHMYWGDVATGTLYTSLVNGSMAEAVSTAVTSADTVQPAPEGVAVDWVSRLLFWTDSRKRTLEVSTLDGGMHKVLIKDGLVSPRGVAVHPGIGKLYWSDWSRDAPKIESANLDGSGRVVLLTKDLKLPNNLVVDYEHNDLCWTDAGTHRIECLNLYTSSRRMVTAQAVYPFDLAIVGSNIYWTDWDTKSVHQIDRNGGVTVKLEVPRGGHGRLYGLVAVPRQCPRLTNACAVANGGCKHLCLPSGPHGGRTCSCPDHGYDENDYCNDV